MPLFSGGFFAMKNLIKLALWAIVIGLIIGAFIWATDYYDTKGYNRGVAEEKAKALKKYNEDMAEKIDNIKLLRQLIRDRELDFATERDKKKAIHKEEIANVERGKDMLIDGIMSGDIKLYHPGKTTGKRGGAECGGNDGETELSTPESGNNGANDTEFDIETTKILFTISLTGDKAIDRLTRAQDYIRDLYKRCSGRPLPPWMKAPKPSG